MDERQIAGRFEDLERRIAALERRMGSAAEPVAPAPAPPVAPAAAVEPPIIPPPLPRSAVALPSAVPAPSAPVAPVPPPIAPASPAAGSDRGEMRGLEHFVGLKLAAWAGGVIVIAGIAIFAKFAIERGWFADVPPAGKLALAYGASLVFAAAGLLLRRVAGRIPAGALLAAGIGGMYVSTCAGVQPFNVFGTGASLVVGVLVAIVGAALTLRMREPIVAGISLFGAYLVPAFSLEGTMTFSPSPEQATAAGAYVTAIYAVALTLARIGPSSFGKLRAVGLLQAIIGGQLIWQLRADSPAITTGFVGLWWAMAVAECTIAALRGRMLALNVTYTAGATLVATPLAILGALQANPATSPYSWLPAAMAAVCVMGAFVTGAPVPRGGIDERDRQEDPVGTQAALTCQAMFWAFVVLAGSLLIAQVGVVVRGGALPVSWAVMGVGATVAAQRVGNRAVPWLGFASMLLAALAAAVLVLSSRGGAGAIVWEAGTAGSWWYIRVTEGLWAPAIVAAALAAGARLWNRQRAEDASPMGAAAVLAVAATLLWISVAMTVCSGFAAMTAVMFAGIAAAFGRNRALARGLVLASSILVGALWPIVLFFATVFEQEAGGLDAAAAVPVAVVAPLALLAVRTADLREAGRLLGWAFGYAMCGAAFLVLMRSVLRDDGSNAAMLGGMEWASFVLALSGAIGALAARGDRWRVVRGVGVVGVVMSVFLVSIVSILRALNPPAGVPWLEQWFLNPGTFAAAFAGAALVGLRGGAGMLPSGERPLAVTAVLGFVVFSASMVSRFFDPGTLPPFESSASLQRAAVSVWLAIASLGLVITGFRADRRAVRWVGLVLLGFTALKVLVLDMAGADPIWRVAAMVLTGLLLVGTSVVYSRATRSEEKPPEP